MTIDHVLVVFFVRVAGPRGGRLGDHRGAPLAAAGHAGKPRGAVLPLVATSALVAAGYVLGALLTLTPPSIHLARPGWLRAIYLLSNICFPSGPPRHSATPRGGCRTARRSSGGFWLAGLYGSGAAVLLLDAAACLPATAVPAVDLLDAGVHGGWVIVVLLLAGWRIARVARAGAWNSDTVFVLRRRDVAVVASLALTAAVMFALMVSGGWGRTPVGHALDECRASRVLAAIRSLARAWERSFASCSWLPPRSSWQAASVRQPTW